MAQLSVAHKKFISKHCSSVIAHITAFCMRIPMGPDTLLRVCSKERATSVLRRVYNISQFSRGMLLIRGRPRISLVQSAVHGLYSYCAHTKISMTRVYSCFQCVLWNTLTALVP